MRAPPSLRTTITVSLLGFGAILLALDGWLLSALSAKIAALHAQRPDIGLDALLDSAKTFVVFESAILVIGCLGMWYGFNRCIARRAKLIIDVAEQLQSPTLRTEPLEGRDELARISQSLHAAHRRLIAQSAALQASEERYRRMAECQPGFVMVNRNDLIEYLNPGGVQMLGADSAERYVGRSPFELVHPDFHETVRRRLRIMRQENSNVEPIEMTFIGADGRAIFVETAASPFRDDAGTAVQVFAHDITARKVAEQKQQALARELAEKNRDLENLLYVASHDLRSPLINIQGFSRTMDRDWKNLESRLPPAGSPEEDAFRKSAAMRITRALSFISEGVKRIDGLLEGLLSVSRLGRAAIRIEPCDATALCRSVLATLHFQIEQAGAEVVIQEPLPPCLADQTFLGQIFANILDNALKFRRPDRRATIHIAGKIDGPRASYAITDNGIGIHPDHISRIFEIFHRLDPHSTPGQGLGLTIVQRCLERMGGTIAVQPSTPGGSEFVFSLPVVPSPSHGP